MTKTKICRMCGASLSVDAFYRLEHRTTGKWQYSAYCRHCSGVRNRERYQNNPELLSRKKEQTRQRRQNPAIRDQVNAQVRRRYQDDPDFRERLKARRREYYQRTKTGA